MDFTRTTLTIAILAILLFVAAVAKVAMAGSWGDDFISLAWAFFGLLAYLFSETVAEYTGHYGLTRDQWFQDPDWLVKIIGGVMLIVNTNDILHLI